VSASLLLRQGNLVAAATEAGEARSLLARLADEDLRRYGPDYARSLGLVGEIGIVAQNPEGLRAFEEAVQVGRRLAKEDPRQRPLLVELLTGAAPRVESQDLAAAIAYQEEALAVQTELLAEGEIDATPVVDTVRRLHILRQTVGGDERSLPAIQAAVDVLRTLPYPDQLAEALGVLAAVLAGMGRTDEADAAAREAAMLRPDVPPA
jgi:hypothetical protein